VKEVTQQKKKQCSVERSANLIIKNRMFAKNLGEESNGEDRSEMCYPARVPVTGAHPAIFWKGDLHPVSMGDLQASRRPISIGFMLIN